MSKDMVIGYHDLVNVRLVNIPHGFEQLLYGELAFLQPDNVTEIHGEVRFVDKVPDNGPWQHVSKLARYNDTMYCIVDDNFSKVALPFDDMVAGTRPWVMYVEVGGTWPWYYIYGILEFFVKLSAVQAGAVFAHASAFAPAGGDATVVTAFAGTGKTSTMLHAVHGGDMFLADDYVLLYKGQVLAYPKPMNLYRYNADECPWLLDIIKDEKDRTKLEGSMWRVRSPLQTFMPEAKIGYQAPLGTVIFLTRSDRSTPDVRTVECSWLARKMARCLAYERREFDGWYRTWAYARVSELDMVDRLQTAEASILRSTLQGARTLAVEVPADVPAADLHGLIKEVSK